jgi:integrase
VDEGRKRVLLIATSVLAARKLAQFEGGKRVPATSKPHKDLRRSWAKALKDARMEYFWLYDLRHTLASRLTQAGISPVFVAQIIGHSSTSILSTYARAIDECRRDAIHKLENLRDNHVWGKIDLRSFQTGPSNSQPLQFHDNPVFRQSL